MCLSHKQTLKVVQRLGQEHDSLVKQWKSALAESSHSTPQMLMQDTENDDSSEINDDTCTSITGEEFSTTGSGIRI